MVIKHCMEALNANGNLNVITKSSENTTRKLSSGYKINIAADDAAGLSISEKMRKQIRGLTRASQNAEDGISLVQIADGALEEVHSMLQRMNELCVKAANGTYSDSDREYIQEEIDSLTAEIDRISATTKFNEIYLLDGSIGKEEEKIKSTSYSGSSSMGLRSTRYGLRSATSYALVNSTSISQVLTVDDLSSIAGVQIMYVTYDLADDVGTQAEDAQDKTITQKYAELNGDLTGLQNNILNVLQNEIVPNAVKKILSTYTPLFDYLENSTIKMGLSFNNNSGEKAHLEVGCYYDYDENYDKIWVSSSEQNKLYYKLSINASEFDSKNNELTTEGRNELEVAVVHEIMHAFMNETLTNGMMGVNEDYSIDKSVKFPNWFIEGMAQTAAGGYYSGNDFLKNMGIKSASSKEDVESILLTYGLDNTDGNSVYGTGYLACMYLGYLVSGGKEISDDSIKYGLSQIIYEINKGESLSGVIAKNTDYESISDFQDKFANDASEFVYELTQFVGKGAGGLVAGLTKEDDILEDTPTSINLFSIFPKFATAINTYPDGYQVFTGGTQNASSSREGYTKFEYITSSTTNSGTGGTLSGGAGGSGTGGGTTTGGTGGGGTTTGGTGGTTSTTGSSTKIYSSKSKNKYYGPLMIQAGADSDRTNKITISIDAMNAESLGISDVNVTTQDLATDSIDIVASAISKVSAQRAELGSYQNRLEHTIKNLDNVVENTTESESLIRDTDMATEMVKFSNNNIIRQVGQAILAQANQSNTGVLAVLGV